MVRKFSKILLTATVLAFVSAGCGYVGFNPPTDDEMVRLLDAHERTLEEIVEILNGFPHDSLPYRYPPFDLSHREDSSFHENLGAPDRVRLDSLLKRAGCECVCKYSYYLPDDGERHRGYAFKVYVDGYSIGSSIEKSLVYILDGEDAAKSEKSRFNYNRERNYGDSLFTVTSDTEQYRRQMRRDSKVHDASIRRHIRGNWLIYLALD